MKIAQLQLQLCGVCGDPLDKQIEVDNTNLIRLFGVIKYGACPICKRRKNPKDPEWIKELSEWMRQYGECDHCEQKLTWYCNDWEFKHGEWHPTDGGFWICSTKDCKNAIPL